MPLLLLPAHQGGHRALESSSGHESEQGKAGELLSQRLQRQTALRGSRKGELTQGVLYSSGLLRRDLDGPYGLVLTLKSSYALLTAAIAVAGFHSLLFLALGGQEREAAQAHNEMHQMETIWKEHPTLTLRATWKRTFSQQKSPSHRQTALSRLPLTTFRGLGSSQPPKSSALSLLLLLPTRWAVHLLPAKAPCPPEVGERPSGAGKRLQALGGNGAAGSQEGHGRNKSIIQRLSSGKAGGGSEEAPAPVGKLQGTALSAGVLDFPRHSPHPVLPISIR